MDIRQICLSCMNGEIGQNGVCKACGRTQLTPQPSDCALPLPTILHGRYLVGSVLGQGGFGITYTAYDLIKKRRVAVKELFPVFLVKRSPGEANVTCFKNTDLFFKYRDRFVEEARLIYSFRSTREIIDVYHIFIENGTGYFSMEYLDGRTLQDYCKANGGKLPWVQLKPIIGDMIRALRVVHKSGNIHRDLSPDNIFLTKNGPAKLIDFGSARYYKTQQDMTKIVKKCFAPWEQYYSKGSFGPWTDIYALAATIYYCLTGTFAPDAMARVVKDTFVPPAQCVAGIPHTVNQAVIKALKVYPQQRFQTVDAFAHALQINIDANPYSAGSTRKEHWRLRCVRGLYKGLTFPASSNIVIGRDASRCSLVFPSDATGISSVHLTLLFGNKSFFPGIRCESRKQISYINGNAFAGYGHIKKLQNGDRISFGDNQVFIIERLG